MCSRHQPLNGADSAPGLIYLTRQQARALGAVALTGAQAPAAELLGISALTLRHHLEAAYERLDVVSITGALACMGWTDVPVELLDIEAPPAPDAPIVWIGGLSD